jgi:hypothetical protein
MTLLQQLVTVAAVVVGATGSYLVSRLTDRDRFSRELRVRWDQRRLDAYLEFLSAAKMTGAYANRIQRERQVGGPSEEIYALISLMEASEMRRTERFEVLMMLADAGTGNAAHALNDALFQLVDAARSASGLEVDDWHQRADRWITTLNEFHVAARTDLGVASFIVRRDTAALAIFRPGRAPDGQSARTLG